MLRVKKLEILISWFLAVFFREYHFIFSYAFSHVSSSYLQEKPAINFSSQSDKICNTICRKTFYRIVKHRSTENFEGLPYVCALLGLSLWSYYAVSKTGEFLLATSNGIGAIIFLVYVVLFLVYAPPEIRVSFGFILIICFYLFVFLFFLSFCLFVFFVFLFL